MDKKSKSFFIFIGLISIVIIITFELISLNFLNYKFTPNVSYSKLNQFKGYVLPNGQPLSPGYFSIGTNNQTLIFIASLQKLYNKDNINYADISFYSQSRKITKTLILNKSTDIFPLAIVYQSLPEFFPATNTSITKQISYSNIINSLKKYEGIQMVFYIYTAPPSTTNFSPPTPMMSRIEKLKTYLSPYLTCNSSWLRGFQANNFSTFSCPALLSQIGIYEKQ